MEFVDPSLVPFTADPDFLTFQTFLAEHNRNYEADPQEMGRRFSIFKENMDHINRHDPEEHGFSLGLNMFADMTDDEFMARYANPVIEEQSSVNLESLEAPSNSTSD